MKESRVFGGSLLIGGSCIGAGMLGLPIMTGICGFFPSLVMFFLACLFMSLTGLLLVEVHGWYGKRDVHFLTMVSDYLGPFSKFICWIFYLFLFYAILVAYIATSGIHFSSLIADITGMQPKTWIASLVFVLLFGWITYFGTKSVDVLNRFLMFIKIAAFIVLVVLGVDYVQPKLILHTDVKYALFPLPLLIISFGFQNIIPTLVKYLDMDTKKVKQSILGGAIFILIVYLIWQFVVIGTVPLEGTGGIIDSYKKGVDGAEAMK
jgi:tyrosine-specific transport protein